MLDVYLTTRSEVMPKVGTSFSIYCIVYLWDVLGESEVTVILVHNDFDYTYEMFRKKGLLFIP